MTQECTLTQSLQTLCDNLQLHPDVTDAVCSIAGEENFTDWLKEVPLLLDPASAPQAAERLAARAGENERNGMDVLAVMLTAALDTYKKYRELGIPDHIFYDTMKCFPRFIEEHNVTFGNRGFNRGYWTWHELSGVLFRLGTLEFEMRTSRFPDFQTDGISVNTGDPILSVHIPSDAQMTKEGLEASFRQAGEFFREFFPDFHYKAVCCCSWLLSRELRSLLSESSRIRTFQDCFTFLWPEEEDGNYQTWLFKRPYPNPADFPEDTSLQRAVKAHVLNGGMIRVGSGVLKVK